MPAVTGPGRYVVLYHSESEGRKQYHGQLHRWDFACADGRFVVSGRRGRPTDVGAALAGRGEVECTRDGDAVLVGIRARVAADGAPPPPL